MDIATVTLDDAIKLLSLPRVVGVDENGNTITAQNGRYGPYISRSVNGKNDSRTLADEAQLFTLTFDEALALYAQPRRRGAGTAKPPLADLGPHPDTGKNIIVKDGRFGPYVTDGEINASLPRGRTPETLTMDEAVELLIARAEKIAAQGGVKRTKKATKKKSAKKTAKKTAKKSSAAKKSTKKTD
jgi:DNA topoisomerase-1